MFGIRPVKTLGLLAILFLIFTATRGNHKDSAENNNSKPMSTYMEKNILRTHTITPQDGIRVLHYLFKEKIHDPSMKCRYKKAKTRWFIECKEGDVIKNNYWEMVLKKNRIKLLARSKSALFLINKYRFKELESDIKVANPKIEKALQKFFIN